MTRDEIEAADPQPGGWALVRAPGVCGWVKIVAIDHAPHDDRVVCVSPWLSNPTTPASRWVPDGEVEVHAIAPSSDEPPDLLALGDAGSAAEPDDNTIAGYAARILDTIVWELPSEHRAPEIDKLAAACRAILNGRDAARLLDAQAGAKRLPARAPENAADLIDAVGEP